MNIVLYKPNKNLSYIGMALLCLSIAPIFIAVITTYVNWVWGTVGLFVIATALFLYQRVKNEQGDLRAARANLKAINERYGLNLDVGDAFKLTKDFPDDEADVRGKNSYIAHGIGLVLERRNGEYTMRRTGNGEEYVKGEAKEPNVALVSEDEAAEHAEYVKTLYGTRESISVLTDDEKAVLSDSATRDAVEAAQENTERRPRRRLEDQ
jgi:hypothetical protein